MTSGSTSEPTLWESSPSWLLSLGKITLWSALGILFPLLLTYLWTKDTEQVQFGTLFWILLIGSFVLPFSIIVFDLLQLRFIKYRITTERLIIQTGILTRITDEIELYRIKDIRLIEPLLQRLVGLSVVQITSSDRSNPTINLKGIRQGSKTHQLLRNQVEQARGNKGVREVDFE